MVVLVGLLNKPQRRLNDADRQFAMVSFQDGMPVQETARRNAVVHSVIQRLRDRFINTRTVEEARMSGRPIIINMQQD